jgi:hypothetical protein
MSSAAIRLVQFLDGASTRVAVSMEGFATPLRDVASTYELAYRAILEKCPIAELAQSLMGSERYALSELDADRRLRAPIHHPEPTRMLVSGTGLTHLGSAEARDRMHRVAHDDEVGLSDSMKMFRMGLRNGKPSGNTRPGVQPEWFFKGTGESVANPGSDLVVPAFCGSAAEEPEIVAVYVVDSQGVPHRLGYMLGNDLSDHVTEQTNYLYLAHSKLLPCSLGPELLLGPLPREVTGVSRIVRAGRSVWEGAFLSGEANMCHSLWNLEYHHFKYPRHRIPDTVHAHFLGCPVMSFNESFETQSGDVFEASVPAFGYPLRNRLVRDSSAIAPVQSL